MGAVSVGAPLLARPFADSARPPILQVEHDAVALFPMVETAQELWVRHEHGHLGVVRVRFYLAHTLLVPDQLRKAERILEEVARRHVGERVITLTHLVQGEAQRLANQPVRLWRRQAIVRGP